VNFSSCVFWFFCSSFFYLIRFFSPPPLYYPTIGLVPSNTITTVNTTLF
jgi:hypothetical protein